MEQTLPHDLREELYRRLVNEAGTREEAHANLRALAEFAGEMAGAELRDEHPASLGGGDIEGLCSECAGFGHTAPGVVCRPCGGTGVDPQYDPDPVLVAA